MAEGEVTDLIAETPSQEAPEDPEEATDARSPAYTDGQQIEYPPYESDRDPDWNPEVVVVDDPAINVDGE